ncbi:jg219 [Pararge aegeria aegeria]|uniref:Jg219 protein n=1 Tax=Pararge aegeria aegeria TaxID=348720 RepID=A0A8S4RYM5_9NEOP|nr:jg219 [Pararge aegeria aegeria]
MERSFGRCCSALPIRILMIKRSAKMPRKDRLEAVNHLSSEIPVEINDISWLFSVQHTVHVVDRTVNGT